MKSRFVREGWSGFFVLQGDIRMLIIRTSPVMFSNFTRYDSQRHTLSFPTTHVKFANVTRYDCHRNTLS